MWVEENGVTRQTCVQFKSLDVRLGKTREWLDILYSVPAVQISGAVAAPPPSSRAPPLGGALCVAADTWNASRLVEALPLYCVFEKRCTDPQVERNGPLVQLTHNSPAQT